MTTLADLTQATWNLLYGIGGFERPWEDRATGTISTGATDLSSLLSANSEWFENDVMEFPAGEVAFVVADTASSVNRGRDGTTAEALSSGDPIIKNPDFPRHRVEQAIKETIRLSLWPHVWTWHQDSLSFVIGDHSYDLDQYVEDVVLVYQHNLNGDARTHWLYRGTHWDVQRQMDSGVATNKNLLRVKKVHDQEETVYYTAKRRPHVDDLDNVSDEIADMIPYAAAGKLATGRNVQQKSTRSNRDKNFQADYEGFMSEFLRMRSELTKLLHDEVERDPEYRPKRRRSW